MSGRPLPRGAPWLGFALVAIVAVGCRPQASPPIPAAHLSSDQAAARAAELANDECERLYHVRPFTAERYPAVIEDGRYRWGRLELAAPGGYSATVSFATDGSGAEVEVVLTTDAFD